MKPNKKTFFQFWFAQIVFGAVLLLSNHCSGAPVTYTITQPTMGGITYTVTYDNIACWGTTTTLTYSFVNSTDTPIVDPCSLVGFVPDPTKPSAAGLIDAVVVPPQPSSYICSMAGCTDGSFDPTTSVDCAAGSNPCSVGGGMGFLQPISPFPPMITYTFTVMVTAAACGLQEFSPCVCYGDGTLQMCLGTISILVVPTAQLSNETEPTICQNSSGITGTLPAPDCECSFITVPCSTGLFPFNYTVSSATGGTVTLLDPTGGVFDFVPTHGFSGTASFNYNVVSDTTPPQFCSATAPGTVFIPVAQAPVISNATFSVCPLTGATGSLAPFVTGGSGSFTFSQSGSISCGTITINPNGTFTFTGPTGPTTCNVGFAATDTTPPNCSSTGTATFTVLSSPTATPQTLNTCIDEPIAGTVTATGGTPPYTFVLVGSAMNGVVTSFDSATGDFIFTPNPGFTGAASFQFAAIDANGCDSIPAGTITINVNPQPTTFATSINGCEDTQVTGSLAPLVTGGSGPLFFSVDTQPSCGSVLIFDPTGGTFIFTPNDGFTGMCCFDWMVNQGGCTAGNTACINVSPAPAATGSNFDVCSFGTVTGNLNNNILPPPPPPPVTFTGGPGVNGNLTLSSTGPFTFMTTISSGIASFPFQVLSGFACPSATQTVTVTVHPPPTVITGAISACSGTGKSGNLNMLVMGNPPFTFTGPITEVNGTVTIQPNGFFTFVPSDDVNGNFTFGVTDRYGCFATGQEFVTVNPSPTAINAMGTACSNGTATGSLTGDVSGGTPPYIFSQAGVAVGGFATVNPNGTYTFTPNPGASSGSFSFQATDTNGCPAVGTVSIAINTGPITTTGMFTGCQGGLAASLAPLVTGANPPFTFSGPIGPVVDGTVTVNPDGSFVFVPFGVPGQGSFDFIVTDSSVPPCTSDPTEVIINLEEGPVAMPATFDSCENVTFTGMLNNFVSGGIPPYSFFQTGPLPPCAAAVTVATGGTFSFTPTFGFTGLCTFGYGVTDNTPCTSDSTVTMDVHSNPFASNSGPFTACEFDGFSGNLNSFVSLGTPPYSFTGDSPVNGTVVISPSGPFTFTPASIGFASFTYSATDSFGCMSNTGIISFAAQESPIVTGPSPLDTCQGNPISSFVVATSSVGIQPFTFSITSVTNGTAIITSTTPTSADFTFTPTVTVFPTPTVVGTVTIRATATNGCYGEFTVMINIHQNPVVMSTGLGSCSPFFSGSLLPLVTGGIPPYTFIETGPISPTGCGIVSINPSGSYSFTAPTGFTGFCTFEFEVTESSVSLCTSTGTVTIMVNQPPIVTNGAFCSCSNTPVSGLLSAFIIPGTGKPPFTYAIIGTPIGGTVVLNAMTGLFTFVPTPGFNGIGSFQFQVTDSNNPPCVSNIGIITIQVPCCPPTGPTGITGLTGI